MRIRLPNIIELTIALSVVAPLAHGEEGTISQEAHVHGLSELSIAMEGEKLEIQFTSPAMNLLGFEHKASTQKDLVAIENTASVLRQHKTLFLFSGGRCDHINTSIDLTVLIESDEHKKEHEKHEKHEKFIK